MKPRFFKGPSELREWLGRHHDSRTELWIGFYRKDSGRSGVSYPEAVDLALCFGWIDGVRRKIDDLAYTNRFTPRKPRSNWSRTNIRRVAGLVAKGAMHPAGIKAFEARTASRTGVYSFERKEAARLPDDMRERFLAKKRAWKYFTSQPPYYQRLTTHWVVSAKKAETRERRFTQLVSRSAGNLWIDGFPTSRQRPVPPGTKAT
jgi:uncharacterized protein YdeI (YjbR/CyaY-like superfamily)